VKACETDESRCRLTHMAVYRLVDLMVCFPFLAGRRFWLVGLSFRNSVCSYLVAIT
jgi:hypothetical protein